MRVPDFILRKLYKRGSLREISPTHFAFAFQNPLGNGTIEGPPRLVVNGISYTTDQIGSEVDWATVTPERPWIFKKGTSLELRLPGRLLRGGNRILAVVPTKEFGPVEVYVEDNEARYCDIPSAPNA